VSSPADYWVIVLSEFTTRQFDFLIISPKDLIDRYDNFAKTKPPILQTYVWVTSKGKCFETRGLQNDSLAQICSGEFTDAHRDFSEYLNSWATAFDSK